MAKTVVVVSKRDDIIKNNIEELKGYLTQQFTYGKKKPEAKSYVKIDLNPAKIGMMWFCSEDYKNFIDNIEFFKTYLAPIVPVFEFNLNSVDEDSLNRYVEQINFLANEFKLKPDNVYIRLNVANIPTVKDGNISSAEVKGLFDKIASANLIPSRIQLNLEFVEASQVKLIKIADIFSSYATKYKIKVASCRCGLFTKPNKWVSHEPCISGWHMEKLMGCKMIRVRSIAPPSENCMCHKYIDILGAGEKFDGDMNKVRSSDKNSELKKFAKDTSANIAG